MIAKRGGQDRAAVGTRQRGRDGLPRPRSAKAASVVTRIAGESGPCSAWVIRSAATRVGFAVGPPRSLDGTARTIPSDGPAGRSIPTSPQTSILAAVTQALPGPDDPVDRGEARLGQAVGERPDRLGATGDHEGVDLEETGRAEQDRVRAAVAVGRGRDDDLADPGDLRRDDGHHQRRRIRGRAAGNVRTDPRQRRPAPLDLDARRHDDRGRTAGAAARRSGGRCRWPGRARGGSAVRADRAPPGARGRSRTRRPSDRPPPTAALAARTAASPPRTDRGQGRSRLLADRGVGDGAAADQGVVLGPGVGVAGRHQRRGRGGAGGTGRPVSGVGPVVGIVEADRLTARSSRSAGPGCPTRRRP